VLNLLLIGKVFLIVQQDVVTVLHFHCDVAIGDKFLEFSAEHLDVSASHVHSSWPQLLLHKEVVIASFFNLLDVLTDPLNRIDRVDGFWPFAQILLSLLNSFKEKVVLEACVIQIACEIWEIGISFYLKTFGLLLHWVNWLQGQNDVFSQDNLVPDGFVQSTDYFANVGMLADINYFIDDEFIINRINSSDLLIAG